VNERVFGRIRLDGDGSRLGTRVVLETPAGEFDIAVSAVRYEMDYNRTPPRPRLTIEVLDAKLSLVGDGGVA
jgi:hypothetical protein